MHFISIVLINIIYNRVDYNNSNKNDDGDDDGDGDKDNNNDDNDIGRDITNKNDYEIRRAVIVQSA
jgi:hypothetical protein